LQTYYVQACKKGITKLEAWNRLWLDHISRDAASST